MTIPGLPDAGAPPASALRRYSEVHSPPGAIPTEELLEGLDVPSFNPFNSVNWNPPAQASEPQPEDVGFSVQSPEPSSRLEPGVPDPRARQARRLRVFEPGKARRMRVDTRGQVKVDSKVTESLVWSTSRGLP
jgi:hypothetical protein